MPLQVFDGRALLNRETTLFSVPVQCGFDHGEKALRAFVF
jgi:hypothetical protein